MTSALLARAASTASIVVVASLGAFNTKGVSVEIFSVELFDHGVSDFLVVDVREAKPATCSRFPIKNSLEADSLPHAGELSLKLLASKFCGRLPM